MRKFLYATTLTLILVTGGLAQSTSSDAAELTKLLKDFLAGASTNDVAMHDRFWADDLIYTRSAGRRVTKAEVMRDVRSAPAPKPDAPKTVFTAEDIQIQQYGTTAVVAFRLVSTTDNNGAKTVANNLNSGTFVKREGKWQVVSWQSTRMPRTEEENKKDVAATEAAFQQSFLTGDVRLLTSLTDTGFVWTQSDGSSMSRTQLVESLSSGKLKYSKLETSDVVVSVFGDTAVIRGHTLRIQTANPRVAVTGAQSPFNAVYTLTFANQGGSWRALAMHTSRIP